MDSFINMFKNLIYIIIMNIVEVRDDKNGNLYEDYVYHLTAT